MAAAVAAAPKASATVYTWLDPFGTGFNWYFPGNWVGGAFPPSSTTTELVFAADLDGLTRNDYAAYNGGADYQLLNLSLLNRSWTQTGSRLRFATGGRITTNGGASSIANNLRLDGNLALTTVTGLTLTGALTETTAGTGNLTKGGAGTLTLKGSLNLHSVRFDGGATTFDGATANLSSTTLGGDTALLLDSTTVILKNGATVTGGTNVNVALNGTSSVLTATGAGTRLNTGGDLYLAVNGGRTATATFDANATLQARSIRVGYGGTGTLSLLGGADATSVGGIIGAGNAAKGTVDVSGAGSSWTLTGGLTMGGNGSVLTVRSGGAVGAAGNLNLTRVGDTVRLVDGDLSVGSLSGISGTLIDFDGASSLTVGSDGTSTLYVGALTGGGTLTKVGNGTLSLSGVNTYSGGTVVSGGTLSVGSNALPQGGALEVDAGAALKLDPAANYRLTVPTLLGGGSVVLGPGTLALAEGEFSGAISGPGGIEKETGGVLTLSGANAYAGPTLVRGGKLVLGAQDVLPTATRLTVEGFSALIMDTTPGTPGGSFSQTVGSLAGNGRVGLGSATLTVGGLGTDTEFSGTFAEVGPDVGTDTGGKLVKVGAGRLTLSGTNEHSGGTAVSGGILRIKGTGALPGVGEVAVGSGATLEFDPGIVYNQSLGALSGAGSVSLGGASLLVGGENTSTGFSGAISGAGSLTKVGTGTLTLSGANAYLGGTTVTGGTLKLGASGALPTGNLVVNGGTLDLNGFDATANDLTIRQPSAVKGAGTFGNGTLRLLGSLTFVDTDLRGVPRIDANLELSPGQHSLVAPITSTFYDEILAGDISGAGGFTRSGDGFLAFAGHNTYSGETILNEGPLYLVAENALSPNSALTVGDQATVYMATGSHDGFTGGNFSQVAGSLAGSGFVSLGSATLTVGGLGTDTTFSGYLSGSGGLVKAGAGTMTLTDSNVYSGATVVNGGTLALRGYGELRGTTALSVAAGAAFSLDPNPYVGYDGQTLGSIAGAGSIDLGAVALTVGGLNATTEFSGAVTGAGSLAKVGTGTLTLSGASGYTGGTTVSGGRLVVAQPSGAYANTATLELATADDRSYGGTITSTTGALVKSGAGVLTLTGSNDVRGGTTIKGGTLRLGSGYALGTYGATGTNGDLTLAGGDLDLNGRVPDVDNLYLGDGVEAKSGNIVGLGTLYIRGKATLNGKSGMAVPNIGGNLNLYSGQHEFGYNGRTIGYYDTLYSGTIGGSGGITKTGGSYYVALTHANRYSGATVVSAGRLYLAATGALPSLSDVTVEQSGALSLTVDNPQAGIVEGSYSQSAGSLSGAGIVQLGDATFTVGGRNSDTTFSGSIYGSGKLAKVGTGSLTLSGASYFSGGLSVQGGVLRLGRSDALSSIGAVDLGAAGTFDLAGFDQTVSSLTGTGKATLGAGTLAFGSLSSSFAFSGAISGEGGLTKIGTGRADLTGATLTGFTGGIAVNGGVLALSTRTGAASVDLAGGDLEIAQSFAGTFGTGITGSGNLLKTGTGTVKIGDGLITGTTTVSGGGLTFLAGSSFASDGGFAVANGAAVTLGSFDTTLSGATYANAGSLRGSGEIDATLANAATGKVNLTALDTLTLGQGANTNAGLIGVAGGALTVRGTLANTGQVSGHGSLDFGDGLANSGALALTGGSSDVFGKVSNLGNGTILSGAGSVLTFHDDVVHNGKEIRTNAGSYTAFLGSVSGAGSYTGTGVVEFDGDLRPGNSPGSVSFEGDVVLGGSNTLQMELGRTGVDHLTFGRTGFLGGTLDVVYYDGFVAAANQSFDLFDGTLDGAFDLISLPTLANGLSWNTSGLYTTGTITVQAVPEPASLVVLGLGALALLRRRRR